MGFFSKKEMDPDADPHGGDDFIEFINRNAYIMIVIDGNSFCWSAFQALKLMIANVMSVAAVNIVGDLLLFLAKLSISIGTAFLAFVMLNGDEYKDEVSSPILICSIISIFAYSVAAVFMGIVEMGIDTTLLCYCRHGKARRYPAIRAGSFIKRL